MPRIPTSPADLASAGLAPFDPEKDADPPLHHQHDGNGHYFIGPKLKQPSFRLLIGRVQRVKDATLRAELAAREASRELRQAIPAPPALDGYGRLVHALLGGRTRNRRKVA